MKCGALLEGLSAAVPEAGLVRGGRWRALQQRRRPSTSSSVASSRRPAKASMVAAGEVLGHLGDGGGCIILGRGGGHIEDGWAWRRSHRQGRAPCPGAAAVVGKELCLEKPCLRALSPGLRPRRAVSFRNPQPGRR